MTNDRMVYGTIFCNMKSMLNVARRFADVTIEFDVKRAPYKEQLGHEDNISSNVIKA